MTDADKFNQELAESIVNKFKADGRIYDEGFDEIIDSIYDVLTDKDNLYQSKIKELEADNLRQSEHKVWLHNRIKELEAKIARMEGVVEAAIKWDEAVDDRVESGILQEKIWALKQLDEVNREGN